MSNGGENNSKYLRQRGQAQPNQVVPATPEPPVERIDPSQFVSPQPQLKTTRTAELDARGIPTDGKFPVVVRQDGHFLARMPSRELSFFSRFVTVSGATAIPGNFSRYALDVYNVPKGQGLIILNMTQVWLDAFTDPLDNDVLTPLQDYQNANGRVNMYLTQNGQPVFNVTNRLFDPVGGGAAPPRNVAGFTILNQNVLNVGNHPTAAFISEAAKLQFVITTDNNIPAHIPTAIGLNIQGYILPYAIMLNFLRSLRVGF